VLIISGVRGDTRRYRTLHLYEQFKLAGVDTVLSHLTDPNLLELINSAAVAVLHRVAYDRYVEKLLADLHKQNALIILDADDFLYDPEIMRWIDSPDFNDPVRASLYRQEIFRHCATLEQCDAITVSTDSLAEMLAPFGKPIYVHRNAYSQEMLALSQQAAREKSRPDDRIVIGYASGTRTHDRDFAMIRPVLETLMERCPQIALYLMGEIDSGQDWAVLQPRVHTFPLVNWRALPDRLARLDINLAPLLPDSPFNQAKSEIKFMEAALVRVPTVASGTRSFAHAIESGRNGFLAGPPEEWLSALEYLVNNPLARQEIGQTAFRYALDHYSPEARGRALIPVFNAWSVQLNRNVLKQQTPDANKRSKFQFTPKDEVRPTNADLALYSIKNRGKKTLAGQLWVYFRRKLAPIIPFRKG
jgi:glycosyltransferase involved in cell wall biosynthesis